MREIHTDMNAAHITTADGILIDAPVLALVGPGRVVVADIGLGGFARCTLSADGWRFFDRYTDLELASAQEGWTADEAEHNPAWQ
jgi:hypothetical protein